MIRARSVALLVAVPLVPLAAAVENMITPPAPVPVLAPPRIVRFAPAIFVPVPPVAERIPADGEAAVSPLPMKKSPPLVIRAR